MSQRSSRKLMDWLTNKKMYIFVNVPPSFLASISNSVIFRCDISNFISTGGSGRSTCSTVNCNTCFTCSYICVTSPNSPPILVKFWPDDGARLKADASLINMLLLSEWNHSGHELPVDRLLKQSVNGVNRSCLSGW